jgi:pimeloyl-ACP methyl ester carboxylesterase
MWVLRESQGLDDKTMQSARFFETLNGDITEDMLAEFLEHAGLVAPGQSARDLPFWSGWVPFRQSLLNSPSVVSHQDDLQRLHNVQLPVLLVKGTGSTEWLHRVIDTLSEHLPHSRVVEFEGGHAPHLVSQEQFLSELLKFHVVMK